MENGFPERIKRDKRESIIGRARSLGEITRRRGPRLRIRLIMHVNSVDRPGQGGDRETSLSLPSLEYYAAASAPPGDRYTSECCAGTWGAAILIDARAAEPIYTRAVPVPCRICTTNTMVLCTDHYELLPLRSLCELRPSRPPPSSQT